jgi:hyaluronan synthase
MIRVSNVFSYDPVFSAYAALVGALIIARYVFFALYNPELLTLRTYRPKVGVIIPARNESRGIYSTAQSLAAQDYPKDKLTVILVNDGSTDDTGHWMDQAAKAFGHKVVHLAENEGKRSAIAAGMKLHNAEITALIDSDVFLRRDALLQIVRGFCSPRVAAVCGHADVRNASANWLTRMQAQQYFIAFRVFRALEGYFRSVICCSGAFSVYRTDILRKLMNEWLNQTFLGLRRSYGDDRGLTNLVLREGYDTTYLPIATAETIVPEGLSKYVKQQIRWRRSFVIESIIGVKHMWRRPLGVAMAFYSVLLVTLVSPVIVTYFLLVGPLAGGINPIGYLIGLSLIVVLHQSFYWAFQLPPATKVGFFSLMPMLPMWIVASLVMLPWAVFTLRKKSWGTR